MLTILVILAGFVTLSIPGQLESQHLVTSAKDLRSLMYMARAMAMDEGVIYRIRFDEDVKQELEMEHGDPNWFQPIVERQVDAIRAPEEYEIVEEPWATGDILRGGIRAYAVIFGEPSFEDSTGEDLQADTDDDPEPDELAPIVFTPDGKAEWMTVWLTTAPEDNQADAPEFNRLSLVMDGRTSQIFVQQPLDDEEIDLLKSYNLAPLIRSDRINQPRLTDGNIVKLDKHP